jgi:hypothetical protein
MTYVSHTQRLDVNLACVQVKHRNQALLEERFYYIIKMNTLYGLFGAIHRINVFNHGHLMAHLFLVVFLNVVSLLPQSGIISHRDGQITTHG